VLVQTTLRFMRTPVGSSLLSAAIATLLWIVISAATGGTALFSVVGGIMVGVIVFVVGYGFRRLVLHRLKGSP
jgi:hypothetical protein